MGLTAHERSTDEVAESLPTQDRRWNTEAEWPGMNDEAGFTYGVINWIVTLWRKLGGER
jgi:hypothetical protein